MLLSAAIDSITEKISIDFEHVQGNTYKAKTASLNQWIHVNILFKLLFWLPYKNPHFVVSELFEFAEPDDDNPDDQRSNCFLEVVPAEDGSHTSHTSHTSLPHTYTLCINGRMRHRFDKLLRKTQLAFRTSSATDLSTEEKSPYSDFSFTLHVTKDPVDAGSLVLTEKGCEDLACQLREFIQRATRNICGAIGVRLGRQITVVDVDINPLPKHPPWVFSFKKHEDDKNGDKEDRIDKSAQPLLGKLINIYNSDYRILLDMRVKMSLLR